MCVKVTMEELGIGYLSTESPIEDKEPSWTPVASTSSVTEGAQSVPVQLAIKATKKRKLYTVFVVQCASTDL